MNNVITENWTTDLQDELSFYLHKPKKRITITFDRSIEEFRVPYTPDDPTTDDGIYYTDDGDDAEGTAKMMHGSNVKIRYRYIN